MYDYTTPFLKSELDYRIDRLRSGQAARRGRNRYGRLRRSAGESRR